MSQSRIQKLERKFFSITYMCFMLIATLALITAIVLGCRILYLSVKSVDTSITAPAPKYSDLVKDKHNAKEKSLAPVDKPTPQEQQQRPAQQDDTVSIPTEFLDIMFEIEKSLKKFAVGTGQTTPSDNTRTKIYLKAKSLEDHIPVKTTLTQLAAEAKKLEADIDRIKQLKSHDIEYITWSNFLAFYFDSLVNDLNQQYEQIQTKEQELLKQQMQLPVMITSAGGAFGTFIVFTMLLVFMAVERNTYALRTALRESAEPKGVKDDHQ